MKLQMRTDERIVIVAESKRSHRKERIAVDLNYKGN